VTHRGHYSGGVIILDEPVSLPEGALVLVQPEQRTPEVDPTGVAGSRVDDRTAEQIIEASCSRPAGTEDGTAFVSRRRWRRVPFGRG
jgi:hypothetical protein